MGAGAQDRFNCFPHDVAALRVVRGRAGPLHFLGVRREMVQHGGSIPHCFQPAESRTKVTTHESNNTICRARTGRASDPDSHAPPHSRRTRKYVLEWKWRGTVQLSRGKTTPRKTSTNGHANQWREGNWLLSYVENKNLPPAMLNRLLRLAAFQNPEFYKAQAMGLSTSGKPRIISCGQDFPNILRCRGVAWRVSAPVEAVDGGRTLQYDNGAWFRNREVLIAKTGSCCPVLDFGGLRRSGCCGCATG